MSSRSHAHRRQGPSRGFVTLVAVGLALILLVGGGIIWANHRDQAGIDSQVRQNGGPPAPVADPTNISVPSINANSSLVGLGLNPDQTMATPPVSKPEQASWYTGAPRPGTAAPGGQSPAVILGHINGGGRQGVFFALARLQPGAKVDVARADHTVAQFQVDSVKTYPKNAFPADDVFGAKPDPELKLVSCGGVLDRSTHNYESNVVATAHLIGTRSE